MSSDLGQSALSTAAEKALDLQPSAVSGEKSLKDSVEVGLVYWYSRYTG